MSSETQGKFQSGQGAFREYIIPGVEITLLPIYPALYIFLIVPSLNCAAYSAHVTRDDLSSLRLGGSCALAVGRKAFLSSVSSSATSSIGKMS